MIDSVEALRRLYPPAKERAVKKQLTRLDPHCMRFVSLSPFVVIATCSKAGQMDASPRGGKPGFVVVADEATLLLPDSPGNNRLDSLTNIIETGRVGMIFFIPGVDETLRINGAARIDDDPELLRRFADERRAPKVVLTITVEEAYLHCAKALMRSKLWAEESRQDRAVLPSMGRMIGDQTGVADPEETQEQMIARYQADL